MESRVALEPGSDLWMLMGGIVVDDQMQIEPGRGFAFDLAQELQPLLMTMSWQALADDGAVQRIEGGKQRGRSVALVVMRKRLRAPPSSTAALAECGPAPGSGFFRRSKAPARARVDSDTTRRCPRVFPQSVCRWKP